MTEQQTATMDVLCRRIAELEREIDNDRATAATLRRSDHVKAPIDFALFGRTILGATKGRNVSLSAAGRTVGVGAAVMSRTARGIPCDLATYALLCRWLGLSLDTFLTDDAAPTIEATQ